MAGYFEVAGTRYEIVPYEDWSFAEAATFQRVAGMPIGKLITAGLELDVNAYLGMFTVSMQRVDPSKSERDLTGLKWSETLENILTIEEEEEEAEPDPQTESPSENGGNGEDDSALQPTPAASGTPHG